ncbi:MAG: M60 family metallopeptidase [Niabella sp.]|nr:M60 family metallopeptidase [Niabella sp.]
MKIIYRLLVLQAPALVLLFIFAGCKKYGFNIPDGYAKDSAQLHKGDSLAANNLIEYARAFPGLVGKSEPRVQGGTVTLNLNYDNSNASAFVYNIPGVFPAANRYSTGFYAAPGEPVTITVPSGVTGLMCQVGVWSNNVSGGQRYSAIITRTQLFSGKNSIQNQFGGHIYILTSYPISAPVTFTIDGACQSADFVFGTTTAADWNQKIQKTTVPWFEINTGKTIFTLPTARIKTYMQANPGFDPAVFAQEWQSAIQSDFEGWIGLSSTGSTANQPSLVPWRVTLDAQSTYSILGYPISFLNTDEWMGKIFAVTSRNAADFSKTWDLLYSFGNLYGGNRGMPNWAQTSMPNLFPWWRAKRLGLDADRRRLNPFYFSNPDSLALLFAAKPYLDPTTNQPKNLETDPNMVDIYRRMIPFMQVLDKLKSADGTQDGFGFINYIYSKTRNNPLRNFISDGERKDYFYESLCEYTGLNCILFFQAWGINISANKQNEMAGRFPTKLNKNIWAYNPFTRTGGDSTVTYLPGQPFATDKWVVTADAEETTSEDGRAVNVKDGDITTYWHTKVSATPQPPYPHYLLIDMQETRSVSAALLTQRQQGTANPSRPKHFIIYVGSTSVQANMTKAFEGDLANGDALQRFNFTTPVAGQYIRIVFTTGQATFNDASMAEVSFL